MMDVLMVGTLAVSFGLVWLLIRWCQKHLELSFCCWALISFTRWCIRSVSEMPDTAENRRNTICCSWR